MTGDADCVPDGVTDAVTDDMTDCVTEETLTLLVVLPFTIYWIFCAPCFCGGTQDTGTGVEDAL